MNHDELRDLLGAYALDAVEPDEAAEIEAHLATCPACRQEEAGYRETASLMGNAGATAPAGLWDRIAADLNDAPAEAEAPGTVVPFDPAERKGRRRSTQVIVALAAAAALVIAVLGVQTIRLNNRVSDLRQTVAQSPLHRAAGDALLDKNHTLVSLETPTGTPTADVIITPGGQSYLVPKKAMAGLDARQTYQVWGQNGDKIVSLGLIGAQPSVSSLRIEPTITKLMVTAEPLGGVPAPDSTVLMQGAITRHA